MQPFQSDFIHAIPQFFHSYIDLPKCMFFKGDPKTKFLLLFLFAVRPPVRPKKFFLTLPLRPTSAIRPGANTAGPILYDVYTLGQNTVWPQVGRRTGAMSGEVFNGRSEGSRTADGRKFLPLFRSALFCALSFSCLKIHWEDEIDNSKSFEN